MDDNKGTMLIGNLKKRWISRAMIGSLLIAAAIALCATVIWFKLSSISILSVVIIVLVTGLVTFLVRQDWKLTDLDVARYLNKTAPELEESALLMLKRDSELNFLQKLQVSKVSHGLEKLIVQDPRSAILRPAVYLFLAAMIFSIILFNLDVQQARQTTIETSNIPSNPAVPEIVLPQIKKVQVTITPPAYTGKPQLRQDKFNIVAQENAQVNWVIQTNIPANKVALRLNDKMFLYCRSANANRTQWIVQMTVNKPGFYQVVLDTIVSERYRLEMIRDKPPAILINNPKTGTIIRSGQPKIVDVNALISDDYGVRQATLFATLASGNGEAVKFKEQQIVLSGFRSGSKQTQLTQRLNLAAMGLAPGDELYFFIQATDDKQQQVRSDVIIVSLEDTAGLMSMDGLMLGLDIKPEFFRSQRQIIIETEQLLQGRDTMTATAFNNRSNDLGIDQQLLRLRYGKFLGEESNTEIGAGHEHEGEDEHTESNTFGNATDILDQFSHKHDIAEDATFFDPETKKQLKATLAEMWKAEGKLRLYKPAEALPFEYNALRLLKDLQQKSRVYVAKTSSKLPPLKPAEKRLTGELDKIGQPVLQYEVLSTRQRMQVLRQALGLLEQLKQMPANGAAITILQQAGSAISDYAAAEPAKYLAGVEAYHKIIDNRYKPTDLIAMQRALQSILKSPDQLPAKRSTLPVSPLPKQYFKNLKNRTL